jgi:hypothetical protein
MVGQVKVVGILVLVHGILVILMGGLYAVMGSVMLGIGPGPGAGGAGGPPPWIFAAIYGGIGLVTALAGLVNAIAGYRIMSFRNRVFGIIALFSNVVPMVTCYCALTGVALMVYGLIVLFHSEVARGFELVKNGASPEEVVGQFTRRYGDVRDDYDEMYDSRRGWEEERRRRREDDEFDDDFDRR